MSDIIKPFDSKLTYQEILKRGILYTKYENSFQTKEDIASMYHYCYERIDAIEKNISIAEKAIKPLEENLEKLKQKFDSFVKDSDIEKNYAVMKCAMQAFNVSQALFNWNSNFVQFLIGMLRDNYKLIDSVVKFDWKVI